MIAVKGFPTTWGAKHFEKQSFEETATVAKRLEEAGAVLVAKLTLGALALGDEWFGGMTRNPWNVKTGSSGSSAGSCSAVAAGLVPFAIGSETLGSIVSPSRTCGVTGLRPTFGRVSRAGCMALSWTMDKIGPIARNVEDTALVFGAIHGFDPLDATTVERPFNWPSKTKLADLTIGYTESRVKAEDRADLKALRELGAKLVKIELPNKLPLAAIGDVLNAECAAAFDGLTRNEIKEGYGRFWGNTFRSGQFISAVEYIRVNRLRTLLMQQMAEVMKTVNLYITDTNGDLRITNLTGHPSICLPGGFNKVREVEMPFGVVFTGQLYGESELLNVAQAFQSATGFHEKRPPMELATKENAGG